MCQEWGVKKGGTWRILRVPDQRYDVIIVIDRPQGQYPESFVMISVLEVCQEWGVKKEVPYWTLRVPNQILGGHGHS